MYIIKATDYPESMLVTYLGEECIWRNEYKYYPQNCKILKFKTKSYAKEVLYILKTTNHLRCNYEITLF